MERLLSYRMNRRAVLGAAAGLGIGLLLLKNDDETCAAPATTALTLDDATPKHNMWVWRFDVDGAPDEVLERVRSSGLGVILKTNEGAGWMSEHDDSPTAITGPDKVREMANFFENAGVPFHAWCVVKGLDPAGEARICSEVLNAGARSMTFDLEPAEGHHYWQADPEAALEFGREIRRLQPTARLGVAPDARPWQIDAVPLVEFASFCDEILPQSYWQTFNSPTNRRFLTERGYEIGAEGVTPEIVLNATADKLRPLGKTIRPIGQGAANGPEWERFIRHAFSLQMDSVSVWRYGTASGEVWPALQANAPTRPVVAAERQTEQAGGITAAAEQAPPPPNNAAEQAPPAPEPVQQEELATEPSPVAAQAEPSPSTSTTEARQEPTATATPAQIEDRNAASAGAARREEPFTTAIPAPTQSLPAYDESCGP